MDEWGLTWQIPIRLVPTVLFALLYAIGGRGPKWVRRFIAGPFFGASIIGLSLLYKSFHWAYLGLPIMYMGALCLGYGSDDLITKIIQRFFYGLILGLIGVYTAFWGHHIGLGLFQLLLAVQASLFLGIVNPTSAVFEEALIAAFSVVIVPFLI